MKLQLALWYSNVQKLPMSTVHDAVSCMICPYASNCESGARTRERENSRGACDICWLCTSCGIDAIEREVYGVPCVLDQCYGSKQKNAIVCVSLHPVRGKLPDKRMIDV